MAPLIEKDYSQFPKFRHNLWTSFDNNPDVTYLTVSHAKFEVPTEEAKKFLRFRSFCTGHNSLEDISKKSGIDKEEVSEIVQSLSEADILHRPIQPLETLSDDDITETLMNACEIWSEQLAETHLAVSIFKGKTSKNTLIGWLLETYHYIKNFPRALEVAESACDNPELKAILTEYKQQEENHEIFVLRTLQKLGVSKEEVETSIPLVTTRLIQLLMEELFRLEPVSVFLVARIIEADDYAEDQIGHLKKDLMHHYDIAEDAFDDFFKHVEIDEQLGHSELLEKHQAYLSSIDRSKLHQIVNKLHDLKHAFDAQKLEIQDYYNHQGNYFPRQFVDYFAI